jgi:hypothetical protein
MEAEKANKLEENEYCSLAGIGRAYRQCVRIRLSPDESCVAEMQAASEIAVFLTRRLGFVHVCFWKLLDQWWANCLPVKPSRHFFYIKYR